MLLDRFRRTIPDVVPRVRVLPRMDREPYLALVSLADVMLDTLHYGGIRHCAMESVSRLRPLPAVNLIA